MFKKILVVGLLLGLVVATVTMFGSEPADATRSFDEVVLKVKRPAPGYTTVIGSLLVNPDHLGGYWVGTPPSGYYINKFNIKEAVCGAAQTVEVRPWYSTTDSTSIVAGTWSQGLVSGGSADHWFDVRCAKLTLTGVADTDDLHVFMYCVLGTAAAETGQN